jgi:hypothetical protein
MSAIARRKDELPIDAIQTQGEAVSGERGSDCFPSRLRVPELGCPLPLRRTDSRRASRAEAGGFSPWPGASLFQCATNTGHFT